jgi:hypothetical protein
MTGQYQYTIGQQRIADLHRQAQRARLAAAVPTGPAKRWLNLLTRLGELLTPAPPRLLDAIPGQAMPKLTKAGRITTNLLRRRRRIALITAVIVLIGTPAVASAHSFSNYLQPGATAPDGTHIVSWTYTPPPPVSVGYASGDYMGTYTCAWSAGFVGTCDGAIEVLGALTGETL